VKIGNTLRQAQGRKNFAGDPTFDLRLRQVEGEGEGVVSE